MPIGKDSITKRVIGAPETTPAPKPVKTTVKKTGPKVTPAFKEGVLPTPTAPKELEAETAKPEEAVKAEPSTAVMGNVSPEVVEKVTGHPEGKGETHVKITDDMPNYLL
ncbi:MAG: hypothetical protein MJ192_03245 [Clostridia bacterium]|nr:hypothetical protein [Clostridia bacterium]